MLPRIEKAVLTKLIRKYQRCGVKVVNFTYNSGNKNHSITITPGTEFVFIKNDAFGLVERIRVPLLSDYVVVNGNYGPFKAELIKVTQVRRRKEPK